MKQMVVRAVILEVFVTTQAREGIETAPLLAKMQRPTVTTQAREGIEMPSL